MTAGWVQKWQRPHAKMIEGTDSTGTIMDNPMIEYLRVLSWAKKPKATGLGWEGVAGA